MKSQVVSMVAVVGVVAVAGMIGCEEKKADATKAAESAGASIPGAGSQVGKAMDAAKQTVDSAQKAATEAAAKAGEAVKESAQQATDAAKSAVENAKTAAADAFAAAKDKAVATAQSSLDGLRKQFDETLAKANPMSKLGLENIKGMFGPAEAKLGEMKGATTTEQLTAQSGEFEKLLSGIKDAMGKLPK